MGAESTGADTGAATTEGTQPPAASGGTTETTQTATETKGGNTEAYWRRQAEKHEKELATIKKAQMSELDRAKAERDEAVKAKEELEAHAAVTLVQSRFEAAAVKAGCHDAEAAYALADALGLLEDVTIDNGKIGGLDKAMVDLKKSKPYLFGPVNRAAGGAGGGNTGSGAPSTPAQAMNSMIRRIAGYGG